MRTKWITAVLALLLVLAGCSAGSTNDSSPAGADSDASVEQFEDDAGMERAQPDSAMDGDGEAAAADDSTVAGGSVAPGAVTTEDAPMMVRRVELKMLVEDVAAAAAQARASVSGAGGWVQSEEIVPGTEDRDGHGSMVLRVPSSDLDGIITSLSELGEVTFTRSTAEDVTAEYRDVEARVATLEAGAERLRDLIADAPSVESIASLERELTSREADLDALKARMKVLEADVSRSTITLHLAEESDDLEVLNEDDDTGFMSGLRAGWEAFVASGTIALTAIGALLPFLALAALLGIPLLLWRRRRTRARTGTTRATSRQAGAAQAGLASKDDRPAAAAGDPDGPGSGRP
ncbi:DUF4349 domain-containing protein [Ornithinimicrobium pratense]|uniref:DUF4349 domain-containing protein n=1 Tax=Ornithinimicrobium pratense TaxID=2593973 RepID=A0A5J6V3V9_9MICO|nr:DUF4349 domain-containing protein [Ornithinimicrobium pratense]QFG68388.1 DUF4349 domain-containing protein [Ornithinimicrobium pratense]